MPHTMAHRIRNAVIALAVSLATTLAAQAPPLD
jgi:hypothetical protein